jgi:xanthine dehydrogenase accessory factor
MADEHDQHHVPGHDVADACAVAHGTAPAASAPASSGVSRTAGAPAGRTLVAVFATPVAGFLLRYGADAGFRGLLVEPDEARAAGARMAGFEVLKGVPDELDDSADVVVTDHHRDEIGEALRDALAGKARWIGIMGNPRHPGPHIEALAALGVPPAEVARVHRPIGLNIGSRTPPEIAIATLAGLLADRNERPGGFTF